MDDAGELHYYPNNGLRIDAGTRVKIGTGWHSWPRVFWPDRWDEAGWSPLDESVAPAALR